MIVTPGTYLITGEIVWSSKATSWRYLGAMVNGIEIAADVRPAVATQQAQTVTTVAELNAGDRVRLDAAANIAGTVPTDTSFGRGAALEVTYMGPKA